MDEYDKREAETYVRISAGIPETHRTISLRYEPLSRTIWLQTQAPDGWECSHGVDLYCGEEWMPIPSYGPTHDRFVAAGWA